LNKKILAISAILLLLMSTGLVMAKKDNGTTIQDGVLTYSAGHYLAGEPLMIGYDPWGYNYQAHMFKGFYANVYLGGAGFPAYEGNTEAYLAENPGAASHWAWPYRDIQLVMKWNDAWLSNKDRDGDGKLDRHHGHPTYIGSGAWETNHQWGDGWNYFCKIVAAPSDANNVGGIWYSNDGIEIGPVIWGQFATILEISNDSDLGEHGLLYKSPLTPGFGYYMP